MSKKISCKDYLKLCIFIVFLAWGAFTLQAKETFTILADGNHQIVVAPSYQSVAGIIKSAGFSFGENDRYELLEPNVIKIVRALKVNVHVDGKINELFTSEPTVAQALAKAGYSYENKNVYPGLEQKPTPEMEIVLLTAGEKILLEHEEIDYAVTNRPDSHMEIGDTAVIKDGVKGVKQLLVKLTELANGKKVRILLAETILAEPQEKIVAFGTTNIVATSRGELRFSKVVQMQATAYTPWDEGCIGITKSGIPASRGVVAVDPDFIPLGTKLYIPGYGHALAADIGGAIVGNRIDLCMESLDEAFRFGRRDIKVYILE